MKIKFRSVLILLALSLILSAFFMTVNAMEDISNAELISDINHEHCYHGVIHDFDDETMTVGNVYEGNLIEDFLIDIERYAENHYAKILKNGIEVTSGLLEQGMVVQVYHGDELYGAYTVDELLTPYPQTNSLLRSSNSYGFYFADRWNYFERFPRWKYYFSFWLSKW